MWTWVQLLGQMLYPTGKLLAVGYSGSAQGRNNPEFQDEIDIGPIPVGHYTFEPPINSTTHGPFAMPLEPDPQNNMHGRSGFMCHGDNANHTASEGCIILDRASREAIWQSGNHQLQVVSGYTDNREDVEAASADEY